MSNYLLGMMLLQGLHTSWKIAFFVGDRISSFV